MNTHKLNTQSKNIAIVVIIVAMKPPDIPKMNPGMPYLPTTQTVGDIPRLSDAFEHIFVDDGMGGHYEFIQYPMRPKPCYNEMLLVPYDKLK